MFTIIGIVLIFLIFIFLVYGYYFNKKIKLEKLDNGICPVCKASKSKKFNPIEAKILKSGGCSGVVEIEYCCNVCGYSEIHLKNGIGSCSI